MGLLLRVYFFIFREVLIKFFFLVQTVQILNLEIKLINVFFFCLFVYFADYSVLSGKKGQTQAPN